MKKILIIILLFSVSVTLCFGQNRWFKVVSSIYYANEGISMLILERNDSLFQVVGDKALKDNFASIQQFSDSRKFRKYLQRLEQNNMIRLSQDAIIFVNLNKIHPSNDVMPNLSVKSNIIWNNNLIISVSDLFHNALYYAEEIKGQFIPKRCELTSLKELIYDEEKNEKTAYEIAMLFKVELKIVEEILSQKH